MISSPCATALLKEHMQEWELSDVWRSRNLGVIQYSWSRYNPTFTGSRIDFFLCTQALQNKVVHTEYIPCIQTDHQCLMKEVDFSVYPRGKGYWRFNNRLLVDDKYVQKAKDLIVEVQEKFINTDSTTMWEMLKLHLTRMLQNYSKNKANECKLKLKELQNTVLIAKQAADINPIRINIESVQLLEIRLQEYITSRTKAAIFRSKARWAKDGEHNSKYLYSLERSNFNKKTMSVLKMEDGTITSNPTVILNAQRLFYEQLFTANPEVKFELINTTDIWVTEEDSLSMDDDLTFDEVTKAMRLLKHGKSPGCDGFTAEFYQAFWLEIGPLYWCALQQTIQDKLLHLSARRGIITLIPKRTRMG